jgi:hypothetical protein
MIEIEPAAWHRSGEVRSHAQIKPLRDYPLICR